MSAQEKKCSKCLAIKSIAEFYVRKDRPCGFESRCKQCCRKEKVVNRAVDVEAAREYQRAMYAKHAEKRRQEKRDLFALNPEHAREINRRSREKHKEKRLAETRAWHAANKDQQNKASRDYYRANAGRIKAENYRYKTEKRKADPLFDLIERVRSLIYVRIRAGGYTKKSRTQEILGCDWQLFKCHMERQFLRGMSWDNRSEWHIDHIIPLATAKTEEDVIRLNHFTNLRPLWAQDNLAKGAQVHTLL